MQVTLHTNHGAITLELYPEQAPKPSKTFYVMCVKTFIVEPYFTV